MPARVRGLVARGKCGTYEESLVLMTERIWRARLAPITKLMSCTASAILSKGGKSRRMTARASKPLARFADVS